MPAERICSAGRILFGSSQQALGQTVCRAQRMLDKFGLSDPEAPQKIALFPAFQDTLFGETVLLRHRFQSFVCMAELRVAENPAGIGGVTLHAEAVRVLQ